MANNIEQLPRYLTYEQMNLINSFRGVNLDLAILGRMMVEETVHNCPCADGVFARLFQVPETMYGYMSSVYGEVPSQQINNMMGQNIIIMRSLTQALMDRNETEARSLLDQWHKNIEDISDMFASMSPYWIRDQWHNLLYRYVQLNYQQIISIITNDCERSLNIFNRIKALTILIGDYQARGVMWGLTEVPSNTSQENTSTWSDYMYPRYEAINII